mmetsp:Transcript_17691/g.41528  ORF Transcript_17691/g.41528 Transcript_17691/m.41528 type:complete len:865 (+) Transcript_17691:110-2704(+)
MFRYPKSDPCPCFDSVLASLRAHLDHAARLVDELVTEHQREVARASLRLYAAPHKAALPSSEKRSSREKLDDRTPYIRLSDASTLEVCKMESIRPLILTELEACGIDNEPLNLNGLLRTTLLEKRLSEDKVSGLLHLKANPNAAIGPFKCNSKEFRGGTPLAVAVLRNEPGVVNILVEAGAGPDSQYSFEAGAEQLLWSGPASHATVPRGDVEMLRMLIAFGADLCATGSNDATLLWQAAYFDQPRVMEFLLAQRADLEAKAKSQDDSTVSHTPLHAAANAGHYRSVAALLLARADPKVDNGNGMQPLEDVVLQGHACVAKLLVAKGADLFHVPGSTRRSLRSTCTSETNGLGLRCIDEVFRSQNPGLVAAVAEGLRELPALPHDLTKEDLVQFLSSPGDAPLIILSAVFRPFQLTFWDARGKRKKRRAKRLAGFISSTTRMNVSQGPCSETITSLFNEKRAAPDAVLDFVERLTPQMAPKRRSMFVPVDIFTCPVPMVHKDLNVLRALADCPQDEVFERRGCQAIVNLKWQSEERIAHWGRSVMFVEVLNLQFISFFLNSNRDKTLHLKRALLGANMLAACLCLLMTVLEIATAVGYLSCGLGRRYLRRPGTTFNVLAILMSAGIIAEMRVLGFEVTSDPRFCIALGSVIFAKWMRFLFSVAQVKSMGLRILPITSTMWEALPFCVVLLMCLLASTSFYFALGILSFPECFVILYRIYALGDVDLFEMENTWAPRLSLPPAQQEPQRPMGGLVIEQDAPTQTHYYWVVRVMMVVLSFIVGVSMMNLFVAVLCRSYVKAAEGAMLSFMRNRACVVLDMHAVRLGLSLLCCRRFRHDSNWRAKDDQATSIEDTAYVWYAVHRDAS